MRSVSDDRHYERGFLLLRTLHVLRVHPGLRATEIAWKAAPERSIRRAAIRPCLVGLWFSGLLTRWERAGYVYRRKDGKDGKGHDIQKFYIDSRGIEALHVRGLRYTW